MTVIETTYYWDPGPPMRPGVWIELAEHRKRAWFGGADKPKPDRLQPGDRWTCLDQDCYPMSFIVGTSPKPEEGPMAETHNSDGTEKLPTRRVIATIQQCNRHETFIGDLRARVSALEHPVRMVDPSFFTDFTDDTKSSGVIEVADCDHMSSKHDGECSDETCWCHHLFDNCEPLWPALTPAARAVLDAAVSLRKAERREYNHPFPQKLAIAQAKRRYEKALDAYTRSLERGGEKPEPEQPNVIGHAVPPERGAGDEDVDEVYWARLENEVERDRRAGLKRPRFETVEALFAYLKGDNDQPLGRSSKAEPEEHPFPFGWEVAELKIRHQEKIEDARDALVEADIALADYERAEKKNTMVYGEWAERHAILALRRNMALNAYRRALSGEKGKS